jgi:aminopeptidase N
VLLTDAALLPTSIARGLAVATVWDMLTCNEATVTETLHCLADVLLAETSDPVAESLLKLATDGVVLWASDEARAPLASRLGQVCLQLAETPSRRQSALRTLARVADEDDLRWLRRAAGDGVDLTWRVLIRTSQLRGFAAVADEAAALETRDPNPEAWLRTLAVRAASPEGGDKAAAWQAMAEERTLPIGEYGEVATAFWAPGQDAVLQPYAERYLELLPTFGENGMVFAMVYAARLFPLFGVDDGFPDRVLAAAVGTAPVVQKSVVERADRLRRMLRARG